MSETTADLFDTPSGPMTYRAIQDRYLRNPGACPICESTDITGDSIVLVGECVTQDVDCAGCGFRWLDSYRLESFLPIRDMKKALPVAVIHPPVVDEGYPA